MTALSYDSFDECIQTLYPELHEKARLTGLYASEQWNSIVKTGSDWSRLPKQPLSLEEKLAVIAALPRNDRPQQSNKPVIVILAGGKGTRMGDDIEQKSLCPICGTPALLRAVEMYRSFGITDFVIVVGVGYQSVIESLQPCDLNISYLYQEVQSGTGHAGRLASRYLKWLGYSGDVMVVMGDKYIARRGLERMFLDHAESGADLTLSVAGKNAWPDSGRVVMNDEGRVCAILEKPDIVLKRLLYDFRHWPQDPVSCRAFLERAHKYWNRPDKLKKILGEEFWHRLHTMEAIPKSNAVISHCESDLRFQITDSLHLLAEEVETQCDWVNISVYLFHSYALYDSMETLRPDNAQGEFYLTDAALSLTSHHNERIYKVVASRMPDDYDVMGFNTPEELARIEEHVRRTGLLD